MMRLIAVITLSFMAMPVIAADAPAGSWKLTLPVRPTITVLFALSQDQGKWVADVVDVNPKLRKEPKFKDVIVNGDAVRFSFALDEANTLSFDGVASKDSKTLKGSISFGGESLRLVELQPSTLKSLADPFDVAKEGLTQADDAEAVFENAQTVFRQAAAKKMTPDEVRSLTDVVSKKATPHGRRWERHVTLKLADLLADQAGLADVALAQARKAERMLADDDEAAVRMKTLQTLVKTLLAANKPDDAKPYQVQISRIESREWADFAKSSPGFTVEEFKGRKGKSDRVVLVETFSGANFDASAAVDAARDGILKAFKPSDVIVLTYHLPLNNDSDPLAVVDCLDRMKLYGEHVQRGRHGLVAGKPSIGLKEATTAKDGELMFTTLRDRIIEELELPAHVKLAMTLTAEKDTQTAKVVWSELDKPAETMTLRLVLAEERIRFAGSNGTKFHQMTVRAMPGGAKGFPMKTAAGEQVVPFKLDEIKTGIAKFLEEMSREGETVPVAAMTALKGLKLVAIVQNDATGDVLTATMVDVK
jgi:hypothetical protein